MLFSQITGLQDVKNNLINSVSNSKIAHAQLFWGAEGSANLAMAVAYATLLNCGDKQEQDACGKCPSCIKYNKLIHPDLHFIFPAISTEQKSKEADEKARINFLNQWRNFFTENPYAELHEWAEYLGAENKQCSIAVAESRNLINKLSLKAFEAQYKTVIIWLPEMMNAAAANAMLKILEEPHERTVFILVANSLEMILPTILSRCQLVKIRSFNNNEIVNILTSEYGVKKQAAQQIAQITDGNLNRAILLCAETQNDHLNFFKEWMRLNYINDIKGLIEYSEKFQTLGRENQKSLLKYGLNIIRETLVCLIAQSAESRAQSGEHHTQLTRFPADELDFINKFSKTLNETSVENFYNLFNDACYHIERNANPRILFINLSLLINELFVK